MAGKFFAFMMVNGCLGGIASLMIESPIEFYSFVTGQGVFALSFLIQIFLVRNLLGAGATSHSKSQGTIGFLSVMLAKFGVLGLGVWAVIAYLRWPPLFFIGGLVVGLGVLTVVFYLKQGEKVQPALGA